MDMNVSPDLEAFCCYGLVLVLGLAVAWSQVSRRLGKLPGQWIMVNTWLLFFAYTMVPVILFWFLDRTNALHDTSLFAAVLVGFGYQHILTGSLGGIRAPTGASKFWQPFGVWADNISDRIRERIVANSSRFDERLLSTIRTDDAKFSALKAVTLVHAADPKLVDNSLKQIASDKDILDDPGVRAKQSSFLYETLKQSSPQQFQYLLHKNNVIPKKWYLWYGLEWRSKTLALLVATILVSSVAIAVWSIGTAQNHARYYVWRLHKENATDYDRFRARSKLLGYAATTPSVYPMLTHLLKVPSLPVKTAENVLGLLVETRQSAARNGVGLQALLVDALRTENSDIRMRIHKVLVYLAKDRGSVVPPELENWQSDPNSPWRNSVHSNDAADNGDSDNFVVVMVVESKNEVFSIPESLETIG